MRKNGPDRKLIAEIIAKKRKQKNGYDNKAILNNNKGGHNAIIK
jgi:hypothetical protein